MHRAQFGPGAFYDKGFELAWSEGYLGSFTNARAVRLNFAAATPRPGRVYDFKIVSENCFHGCSAAAKLRLRPADPLKMAGAKAPGREQTPDHLVEADPEKTFFTEMLTRDIELRYAILDLLDNCFDGITRTSLPPKPGDAKPYAKYWARIRFDSTSFSIEDNCGGIPRDTALHYAFKFGKAERRAHSAGTVGFYGIGMKRAIFKMGKHATVVSQYSANESLTVEIPIDWTTRKKWGFPYEDGEKVLDSPGTRIVIDNLWPSISDAFSGRKGFPNDLETTVARYYGRIMERGFQIYINDELVPTTEFRLLVPSSILKTNSQPSRDELRDLIVPYKFDGTLAGVRVAIICGFYAPLQTDADNDEFDEIVKASSENAGWTVSCNDRVVLYNDKTRLTGWGDSGIPLYHSQFRTFAGLVQFRSEKTEALPMNTTKRGVDANSVVYLEALEIMRAGLRTFVNFTNKWKSDARVRQYFKDTVQATLPQIERARIPLRKIRLKPDQFAYNPELPDPPSENPVRRISFSKTQRQVATVRRYLEIEAENAASEVGEAAFDYVLAEARS
jgi:Histidine kinase-, DNA gyrase B-, and HSP90-like ATPase